MTTCLLLRTQLSYTDEIYKCLKLKNDFSTTLIQFKDFKKNNIKLSYYPVFELNKDISLSVKAVDSRSIHEVYIEDAGTSFLSGKGEFFDSCEVHTTLAYLNNIPKNVLIKNGTRFSAIDIELLGNDAFSNIRYKDIELKIGIFAYGRGKPP